MHGKRSSQIESFIGESPDEENQDETPDLMTAIERAATAAGEADKGGLTYEIAVEVDVSTTNQWVKQMRVIITPHGGER
jgi:hypothetical protein